MGSMNETEEKYRNNNGKNLGEQIYNMVQDAVDSMDFSGLNERIRNVVRDAIEDLQEYSFGRRRSSGAYPAGKSAYEKKPVKVPQLRPVRVPGTWSGPFNAVLGGLGAGLFGLAALTVLPAVLGLAGEGGIVAGSMLATEVILLSITGLFAYIMSKGILTCSRVRRIQNYMKAWRDKSFIMFTELQNKTGYSLNQIRKDMHFLLSRNLLPGSRMDEEETCLLLTDESIRMYESAKASQREREKEQELEKMEEEFLASASDDEKEMYVFSKQTEEVLGQIDHFQEVMISGEMRKKLARFEVSLTRIFVCVKERPEKIRKTTRLMNYYVPSVIRLLTVYEDIEKQPVQGENILKSRGEIESSMDAINDGLDVMYDELFAEDALDVSADARVLRVMLAQDGWTKEMTKDDPNDASVKGEMG